MDKIKVVFLHYKLVCGGAEQALYDLIGLMDKSRFSCSVFVQVPGGPWEDKFRQAGIPVIYDYSCRKPTWNPVKKLGNLRKKLRLDQAYRRDGEGVLDVCLPGQVDIAVSYSAWCWDSLAFCRQARTVKYIHGDPGTNPVYHAEASQKRDLLARFDRIVCVSQAAYEAFRQISGLTAGVQMHYNPIDSEHVRRLAREAVQLPDNKPLICAVGRLSPEKGFERLLILHKNLLEQGIDHNLVLVGDGEDRPFLERLIRATGTQDSVILAGYQANPYPYMAQSRFLVNASLTEGLPVIAMEALCLGIPVVAPVPSVGEAFGDEPCGLITENDVPSLEAGVRKMLTDEAFYAKTKEAAQRRSTYFDGKRMVAEIEDMFLRLMQEEP